jgi:hypothetical protein
MIKRSEISEFVKKNHKDKQNFAQTLFQKYEVQENPKAQKAFEIAWDYGHVYGLLDVENVFIDLLPLIEGENK